MDHSAPATIADAIAAVLPAYEALIAAGEEIEDEWSYVQDLSAAWLERFDEVAAARASETVTGPQRAALAALTAEVATIDDPHRAIDWLSTYPQVVLIALGERP